MSIISLVRIQVKGGPSQYNLRKLILHFVSFTYLYKVVEFSVSFTYLDIVMKLSVSLSYIDKVVELSVSFTYLHKVVELSVSFTYLHKVVELSVLDEEVFVEGHRLFVAAAERSVRTLHLLSRLSRKLGRKKPHVISQPISRKRSALAQ